MHKQVNLSWMLFDFLYFGAAIACFVFACKRITQCENLQR